ncbi:hypothetical protein AB7M39_000227 [Bradyrhizobium diazoefficiens]
MLGVALRSSRISLNVPFSSGRSAKTRQTRPLVIGAESLPYFAVSDSTPCPGAAALSGAAGGTVVTAGGGMLGEIGWVRVGGRLGGAAPGPEGGARLTAPPGSGTDAGGTGGGRSEKSCAWATPCPRMTRHAARINAGSSDTLRRHPMMPSPPIVMPPAFHRKRGKFKPLKPQEIRPRHGLMEPG